MVVTGSVAGGRGAGTNAETGEVTSSLDGVWRTPYLPFDRGGGYLPKSAGAYKKTPIGCFRLPNTNSYPCEMGDEERSVQP